MEATASHTVARSSSARAHLMVGCAWVGRLAAMTDAGVFGGSCSVAVSLRAGAHVREGGVYAYILCAKCDEYYFEQFPV